VKPFVLHVSAEAELDRAMRYYEKQRRGLGLALQDEVHAAIRKVRDNPALGSPYKNTDVRFQVVHRFPYVVYYQDLPGEIFVVAIAHGSRRTEYWRRRKRS
jgi:toxin ParE1/3/4